MGQGPGALGSPAGVGIVAASIELLFQGGKKKQTHKNQAEMLIQEASPWPPPKPERFRGGRYKYLSRLCLASPQDKQKWKSKAEAQPSESSSQAPGGRERGGCLSGRRWWLRG